MSFRKWVFIKCEQHPRATSTYVDNDGTNVLRSIKMASSSKHQIVN